MGYLPRLEAVAVVLILTLAAVIAMRRLLGSADEATVGATIRVGGSEIRCTTTGQRAATLALMPAGVVTVALLTR